MTHDSGRQGPGHLHPQQLKDALAAGEDLVVLDVREAEELVLASLPSAVHVPLRELMTRVGELDPSRRHVVVCHRGLRSARAAAFLASSGFERVENLTGGIDAWSVSVDPGVRRY